MILGFTGDVSLNNRVPQDVFDRFTSVLPQDLRLFLNFESTLFGSDHRLVAQRDKILVTSPVERLDFLSHLPICVACVGNNHVGDYGNDVAAFTMSQLAHRFPTYGAGLAADPFHRLVHEVDGVRIGFLSYCASDTSPLHATETRIGPRDLVLSCVREDVRLIRGDVDHIVAVIHWGEEDIHYPSAQQCALAWRLIDVGVDLIVGSHSHAVQGMSCYQGKYVFFSLGNCFFPDIEVNVNGRMIKGRFLRKGRWGILPYFRIEHKSIKFLGNLYITRSSNGYPCITQSRLLERRFRGLSASLSSPNYERFRKRRSACTSVVNRLEELWLKDDKLASAWRKAARLVSRVAK